MKGTFVARMIRNIAFVAAFTLMAAIPAFAATINANPGNYRNLLSTLQPDDTMVLEAGTYTQGLPILNMNGQPGMPIIIEGPASGPPAVFNGRSCCNTVSIGDSSYIVIRNIQLNGLGLEVDGVKAESTAASASNITLDGLTIINHGANQQIVGISTKCPTWGWIIRNTEIIGAGTGMYLGDSDGSAPFVDGLIEYNLIRDTIGYNAQIKHQINRPNLPGMPASAKTVIRHNVFSKAQGGSTGEDARPNLLVGHWPLSGNGSTDVYEIYGNVFFDNPTEALFQGEGNVALYANLFRNSSGMAVNIQPHNDVPRKIRIFLNTVVATTTGIRVTGGSASFTQEVTANGSFAATPISGGVQAENITGTYAQAANRLTNPYGQPGAMDFFPLVGMMTGSVFNTTSLEEFEQWNLDFNGAVHDGTFRGAYAGEGTNPGWIPSLEIKPACAPPGTPTITSITDVNNCASNGIQVNYNGGASALSHDLIQDGVLVVSGYVSGATFIPADNASHSYIVRAVDGDCSTDSAQMNGTDGNNSGITLDPTNPPDGTEDEVYADFTFQATGGTGALTFSATGLPNGMNVSTAGVLSGTPADSGTFNVNVLATDTLNCSENNLYSLNIVPDCIYCDDFEDGILSGDWTYLQPSWSESGGALIATPTGTKASAIAQPAFAGCTNCTVRATMQTAGGVSNTVTLLAWYKSKRNRIELVMKEEADKWILKERSGNVIVAKANGNRQILPNVSYEVELTFTGSTYQLTVDGNSVLELTPTKSHTGTVGFESKNTTGTFGEIFVN